jgi:hypothetical protein
VASYPSPDLRRPSMDAPSLPIASGDRTYLHARAARHGLHALLTGTTAWRRLISRLVTRIPGPGVHPSRFSGRNGGRAEVPKRSGGNSASNHEDRQLVRAGLVDFAEGARFTRQLVASIASRGTSSTISTSWLSRPTRGTSAELFAEGVPRHRRRCQDRVRIAVCAVDGR